MHVEVNKESPPVFTGESFADPIVAKVQFESPFNLTLKKRKAAKKGKKLKKVKKHVLEKSKQNQILEEIEEEKDSGLQKNLRNVIKEMKDADQPER